MLAGKHINTRTTNYQCFDMRICLEGWRQLECGCNRSFEVLERAVLDLLCGYPICARRILKLDRFDAISNCNCVNPVKHENPSRPHKNYIFLRWPGIRWSSSVYGARIFYKSTSRGRSEGIKRLFLLNKIIGC